MNKIKKCSLVFLIISFCLIKNEAKGQSVKLDSTQVNRLVELGKLWGKVRYFHPFLGYKRIDWDQALVEVVPQLVDANSSEYKSAITQLLNVLEDPLTKIIEKDVAKADNRPIELSGEEHPYMVIEDGGVAVVHMSDYTDLSDYFKILEKVRNLKEELKEAKGIVFDLRRLTRPGRTWGAPGFLLSQSGLAANLVPYDILAPGLRVRTNVGLPGQAFRGLYYHGFINMSSFPLQKGPTPYGVPVVFLINGDGEVPEFLMALQASGLAYVIREGGISEADQNSLMKTANVSMGHDINVRLRISELINPDGSLGFLADEIVPQSDDSNVALKRAVERATDWVEVGERPKGISREAKSASSLPYVMIEKGYEEMKYPDFAHRILAVYRVWNTVQYLFPYEEYMDRDWRTALPIFIKKIAEADDGDEYRLTVAEMLAWIQDNHAGGFGMRSIRDVFLKGNVNLPLTVDMVEGRPVVVQIWDEELAKSGKVKLGDEIVQVDGESALGRINSWGKYIAASRKETQDAAVARVLLSGPDGSNSTLSLKGGQGEIKSITLSRNSEEFKRPANRSGDIFRNVADDLAYIDLERVQEDQLEEVNDLIENSKGVILDMRGYPASAAPYRIINTAVHEKLDNPALRAKNEYMIKMFMTLNLGDDDFGKNIYSYGKIPRFETGRANPCPLRR